MANLIGHERLIDSVDSLIREKKMASAILIEGAGGVGKTSAALYIASRLLEGFSLNEKNGVIHRRIFERTHPDLTVISDDVIKKEKMEEIIKTQYLKPFESDCRVFIIDGFDKVTLPGQNALLKTLEEPPSHLFIILTTDKPEMILSTIRSRCRLFSLFPIENDKVKGFLDMRKIKNSQLIAELSRGSIGEALKITEDPLYVERMDETLRIVDMLIAGDEYVAFSSIDFFEKEREHIEEILDIMTVYLRDIALFYTIGDSSLLKLRNRLLSGMFEQIDLSKIIKSIREIEKTKQKLKSSANFALTLELLLLNIQEVHVFGKRSRGKV